MVRARGRRLWACAALAALAVLAPQLPASTRSDASLRASPAAVAQLLADLPRHFALSEWHVVADGGNYTSWHYRATFSCGPGCDGEAEVEAHAHYEGAPRHGRADRHEVRVLLRTCGAWLLPWPRSCGAVEAVSLVRGAGAGSVLREVASTRCPALSALWGSCARQLRAARLAHLERLRRALGESAA